MEQRRKSWAFRLVATVALALGAGAVVQAGPNDGCILQHRRKG